jgi:hypothetical protein
MYRVCGVPQSGRLSIHSYIRILMYLYSCIYDSYIHILIVLLLYLISTHTGYVECDGVYELCLSGVIGAGVVHINHHLTQEKQDHHT